jgi:metal-responsive CopG/Arc/MetJ family transcriptional regulator
VEYGYRIGHVAYCVRMKISLTLPDEIAHRFLALIPSRQRSAIVARLLEQELRQREQDLEAACLAANADVALAVEIEEWQEFDDDLEESPNS